MDNQSESEFPLTRAEYQRQIRRGITKTAVMDRTVTEEGKFSGSLS